VLLEDTLLIDNTEINASKIPKAVNTWGEFCNSMCSIFPSLCFCGAAFRIGNRNLKYRGTYEVRIYFARKSIQ